MITVIQCDVYLSYYTKFVNCFRAHQNQGRFKYQVRIYWIFLLKTNIGDLKFNFSLGLLLILFCISVRYTPLLLFVPSAPP